MNEVEVKTKETNETVLEIKVKYHSDIDQISRIVQGDWIDLRAAEDVFIPIGQFKMISLGVSMQLPEGYEAHVVPRSSTFNHFGILMTNSFGVIDNSYCGDNDIWKFPAYCVFGGLMRNGVKGTLIKKNDRICQFRIVKKMPEVVFDTVVTLGNADRGGFGSTGV